MRTATFLCICAFALTAGCAATGTQSSQPEPAKQQAAVRQLPGFIDLRSAGSFFADPLKLVPPPPAEGTALFETDKQAYKDGLKLKGTKAWEEARMPPILNQHTLGKLFSVAMGMELSEEKTPAIVNLLNLASGDGMNVSRIVKRHYKRLRPYLYFREHTCATLEEEERNRYSGSYTSGHSVSGWVSALVLSEINPDRANELLKTGRYIGDSRVICGFHWKSDVEQARLLASYVYAQLHAEPDFIEAMQKAKAEFAKIRAQNKK